MISNMNTSIKIESEEAKLKTKIDVSAEEACQPDLKSKPIAFVGIMSALGTVLVLMGFVVGNILPQVATDLSHVAVYIVAVGGGPFLGAVTGALVGIIPAFRFNNVMLVPGKMMTGITVGVLALLFNKIEKIKENKVLRMSTLLIAGIVGYLPEYFFTVWDLQIVLGYPEPLVATIMIKAWMEIIIISVLTAILMTIPYLVNQVDCMIGKEAKMGVKEYILTSAVIGLTILFSTMIFIGFGYNQIWFSLMEMVTFTSLVVVSLIVGVLVIFVIVKLRARER